MLRFVKPSSEEQKMYPKLGTLLRSAYLAKRAIDHMRFVDFSVLPGRSGYFLWKLGIVDRLQRRFTKRPPRPDAKTYKAKDVAIRLPVMEG
jgi:hypothetical protein